MGEKMIIYTMGIKKLNEAVQKVLFEKGYEMEYGYREVPSTSRFVFLHDKHENEFNWGYAEDWERKSQFKEITFRELCELPPVHDELEELADELIHRIKAYQKEYNISDGDLCEVRKKVEKKLGL